MSVLLLTQRSESVRQTSSYYHKTLQPYRSPEASSSTKQHHERETAYPRCIGTYNLSPRIVRAGGEDAYTPTTSHQPSTPTRKKSIATLSPHGVLLSVVVLAAVCNSVVTMRACCHRLLIYVPDHHHAAPLLFGQRYRDCFGMYGTDPILNFVCNRCVFTTTVYCFFCYNRQQQQHAVCVIYTAAGRTAAALIYSS